MRASASFTVALKHARGLRYASGSSAVAATITMTRAVGTRSVAVVVGHSTERRVPEEPEVSTKARVEVPCPWIGARAASELMQLAEHRVAGQRRLMK